MDGEIVYVMVQTPWLEYSDLDFLDEESTVSEKTNGNTFTDTAFIDAADPDRFLGNRVRFPMLDESELVSYQ